jgi:hypothetical protein
MSTEINAPKVFISYSWKPIQNKQKVLRLAERLTTDGVHVILDDWDLKEGHDKYSFMEQMVNNPKVIRVLLVCNKEYTDKANQKKGGVGIESLIVSDDIYSKADQTKFIPIVFEYDVNGKPCVPTFVKTRIFVDLSNEDIFEDNYEILLRNIFDKPASKRPPLGTIPAYIETEDPIFLPTAHKVSTLKGALINEKKNAALLVKDYLDNFVKAVSTFDIKDEEITAANYDEVILKRIEDLVVLRNDFIDFIEVYTSHSLTIDSELLHRFFEKLIELNLNNDIREYSSNTLGYLKADSRKFFYYELFLTFTAMLLEKERFDELAYILQTHFIVELKNRGEIMELTFTEFRQFVSTLNEHRNKKYSMNRVSVTADTIKQRATENIKFEKLVEADLLLYYISLLFPNKNAYYYNWFPETSCYRSYRPAILAKSISERYFNKIKVLFGVGNKQELVDRVNEIIKNNEDNIQRGHYNIPNIKAGLRIDDIGKMK